MENLKLTAVVTGILMTLIFNNVHCTLTTKPKDAAAKIGDFVIMRCSSSHVNDTCGGITWQHFKQNSTKRNNINTHDQVRPSFASDISIIDSTGGNCDLRINATPSAAGEYQCFDFDSVDTNTSAVLIVLENVPEVTVVNQSPHGKVITVLECSVKYYGKLAPKAQWVKIVGNSWTNVTETDSKIIENPVLGLNLIQFSSFIQIPKDGANEHFMCDITISTITWSSLECPAGRNKAPKPYNDGLGHGIGIGFFICLCLCGIIFLALRHFYSFSPKRGATETKIRGGRPTTPTQLEEHDETSFSQEGTSLTKSSTSTVSKNKKGGSRTTNPYENRPSVATE